MPRIVEVATDITATAHRNATFEAQVRAINRSQAVVELAPDGTLLDANASFTALLGYDRAALIGRHHRLLCDQTYAASADDAALWRKPADGQVARDGRTVWLRAT